MPADTQSNLEKTIAWNHNQIKIPGEWEVDSLAEFHMIIGQDTVPRLEIKWTDSPKRFNLASFLKKFIKQTQRELSITIEEQNLPGGFKHRSKDFEFFFFNWTGHGTNGYGTLIFCKTCKRLTLLRFFKTNHLDALTREILMSFQDHPVSTSARWAVFGLDMELPDNFSLKNFEFKPGQFQLDFISGRLKLTVYSWGPAEFLLSKTDLSEFAKQQVPFISGLAKVGSCLKGNYLEWMYKQDRFKNAGLIPFASKMALFSLFRICHDNENNRILGVKINSPNQFEHQIIKRTLLGDI